MTKGSYIHDDVSHHFSGCAQCRKANPEAARVAQPGSAPRLFVPNAVLAAMCLSGRSIYQSYLRWLAEPDE
jgi:hypothetical protein